MPNWCENQLTIRGKKEDILDFIDKFKGSIANYWDNRTKSYKHKGEAKSKKFTFNALYPVPEETLEIGYDGGYIAMRMKELGLELGLEVPPNFGFAKIFGLLEDVSWVRDADKNKTIPKDKYDDDKIVELLLLCERLKIKDGHDWQCDNWGVKWDLDDDFKLDKEEVIEIADGIFSISTFFYTANSAPKQFFKNVAPQFKNLYFELLYGEPGMNFSGVLEISKGEVELDSCGYYGEHFGEPYEDDEECVDDDDEEAKDNEELVTLKEVQTEGVLGPDEVQTEMNKDCHETSETES